MEHKIQMTLDDYKLLWQRYLHGNHSNIFGLLTFNGTLLELAGTKCQQVKIIEEEEVGFIYETVFDSTATNYGFKYLKIQGDKEYIFQTGLVGTFGLDDVKMMYEAVKNEKQ